MVEPALFGPVDAVLAPVIEFLLLALVLANLVTRFMAHRSHVRQAENGAESLERNRLHELSNGLLVVASFYYLTLHSHAGTVLSILVLGTVVADFFEFEGRQIELRQEWELEPPKGAIAGSLIVLAYAAYLSLFFVIQPYWDQVI